MNLSANSTFKIYIPEQNIDERLDKAGLVAFLQAEMEFYNSFTNLLERAIPYAGRTVGHPDIPNNAKNRLGAILKDVQQGDSTKLNTYVQSARGFRLIVGQGDIAEQINKLIADKQEDEALWIFYLYCPDLTRNDTKPIFAPYRAALVGGPVLRSYASIKTANAALERSEQALDVISEAKTNMTGFVSYHTDIFSKLEEKYRNAIPFEEPAKHWAIVAQRKQRIWMRALIVFCIAIVGAVILVLSTAGHFLSILVPQTAGASGISVAGVVAISVPALLYAWMLKNIGRIFLQNLSLADDAEHRRSLSITYLGLAENPKLALTEQDRALILNALFRPIPPYSQDEGPPMGLVDLIRDKAT